METNSGGNGDKKPQNKAQNPCGKSKNKNAGVCVSAMGEDVLKGDESTSGNGSKKKNSSKKITESSIISLKRRMHKEIFEKCLDKHLLTEIDPEEWEDLQVEVDDKD